MVKNMEKECGLLQMEIFMMDNGSRAKFKVMGYINLQMVKVYLILGQQYEGFFQEFLKSGRGI